MNVRAPCVAACIEDCVAVLVGPGRPLRPVGPNGGPGG